MKNEYSRARIRCKKTRPQVCVEDFLMHYGVKGQKWGVRNYQNPDGTFTQEGLQRYRQQRGYGPRSRGIVSAPTGAPRIAKSGPRTTGAPRIAKSGPRTTAPSARVRRLGSSAQTQKQRSAIAVKNIKKTQTPEQIKARRAKAKKILAITAGVAAAAALGYAAYKGSTNLRDQMRRDILNRQGQGYESINTLHSKYWNAADRAQYTDMVKKRAKMLSDNTTRRDAIVAKIYEKTGHQLNLPQSRARVLQERRSSQELGNFIRDAEKRGHLNKSIHDARSNLRAAQNKLNTYKSTPHIGVSKQYEQLWTQKHADNVELYRRQLEQLLKQRAGGF